MCAIDFPDTELRNKVADRAYDLGMVILGCGHVSLRFRPPLDITVAEVDDEVRYVARLLGET